MKRIVACLLACLLLMISTPVLAAEDMAVEIHTIEDLLAISQDPNGSYILMEDLDLKGVEWTPIDFGGSFNGNGHAIINVQLSRPGLQHDISYDGNLKEYDTAFVGFFGTLRNATVRDLRLINVTGVTEWDEPVFVGGLAGFSRESTISGCTVTGRLELRAHDRMFGIGGVVGYGTGIVENCTVDVTLICTDTDPETKDEQFLGGVFSTGFMDVLDCSITIDGYVSEYGYTHNGGITGMYMQKPLGVGRQGKLTGNTVKGKITFFECNEDRRAYCKAEAGEILARTYNVSRNQTEFIRDERKEYAVELRPEMCEEPAYSEAVTPPTCTELGYTAHTCNGCGYSYTDGYTLPQHTVTDWKVTVPATVESEGVSVGSCDGCGVELTRTEEKLAPPPETEPTTAPAATEPPVVEAEASPAWIGWLLPIGAALICAMLPLMLRKKQ